MCCVLILHLRSVERLSQALVCARQAFRWMWSMRTPASSEPGADGKYIVVKFEDEKNGCIWLFDFEWPAPQAGA